MSAYSKHSDEFYFCVHILQQTVLELTRSNTTRLDVHMIFIIFCTTILCLVLCCVCVHVVCTPREGRVLVEEVDELEEELAAALVFH